MIGLDYFISTKNIEHPHAKCSLLLSEKTNTNKPNNEQVLCKAWEYTDNDVDGKTKYVLNKLIN